MLEYKLWVCPAKASISLVVTPARKVSWALAGLTLPLSLFQGFCMIKKLAILENKDWCLNLRSPQS